MNDILQEAERLDRKIKTKDLDGIDINEICICFGLQVAEIKRLREENEAAISEVRNAKDHVLLMHDRLTIPVQKMNRAIIEARDLKKQIAAKDIELVRWQKIATDLKAERIQDANSGDFIDASGNHFFQVMDIEKCREQTAKELQLQVTQESNYIDRLERGLLEAEYRSTRYEDCLTRGVDCDKRDGEYQRMAQAALTKIRGASHDTISSMVRVLPIEQSRPMGI